MRKSLQMLVACFCSVVVFASIAALSAADSPVETASSSACIECHESEAASMSGTAHDVTSTRTVTCASCHSDVSAEHLEDPEAFPPRHLDALRTDSLTARCASCHAHPHTLNMIERDPHEGAGLSCASCHRVHDNKHAGLLHDKETTLCVSCHASVKSDFAMPSHHPVMEEVVSCADCHMTVSRSAKQHTGSGPGETCTTCHALFQGPFPFEHQAAVEYSTEEGGCMNCHAPHGSTQPRLLRQPLESGGLCMHCHVVPKHQFNSNHGSMWAGLPCLQCHVDVHGSYESRHLLDPGLAAQGCFAAGCHQL